MHRIKGISEVKLRDPEVGGQITFTRKNSNQYQQSVNHKEARRLKNNVYLTCHYVIRGVDRELNNPFVSLEWI